MHLRKSDFFVLQYFLKDCVRKRHHSNILKMATVKTILGTMEFARRLNAIDSELMAKEFLE